MKNKVIDLRESKDTVIQLNELTGGQFGLPDGFETIGMFFIHTRSDTVFNAGDACTFIHIDSGITYSRDGVCESSVRAGSEGNAHAFKETACKVIPAPDSKPPKSQAEIVNGMVKKLRETNISVSLSLFIDEVARLVNHTQSLQRKCEFIDMNKTGQTADERAEELDDFLKKTKDEHANQLNKLVDEIYLFQECSRDFESEIKELKRQNKALFRVIEKLTGDEDE